MRISLCFVLLALIAPGCAGVDPVLECDSTADCHEGYACDDHTKTCLTSCTTHSECIDKSQLCDLEYSVCRTYCGENSPCADTTLSCVKAETGDPVSTEDDGNPETSPEGICRGS